MGKNKKNNNKGGKKTEVQTVEGNSVDAQIASIQSVDNTSTIAQPNKSPPPVEPPQELIPDTTSAVPPSRASTASPRNPPSPMRASPKIRVSLARTGTPISSPKAPGRNLAFAIINWPYASNAESSPTFAFFCRLQSS
ncbi:hypothetical protein R3P38DRAFT_3240044 [Favolaschia claudopus]|uniref:Uncharacterized protein n=1 Tax=Favolaschia claudopus TaxID=2862362 RepID=A0AAV9Z781_9AGAR